jgi:3-dehydroquinate synthase
MFIAAKMAPLCGLGNVALELAGLLEKYGFDLSCGYTADELYDAILSDKKRRGGEISVVLPRSIGDCVLVALPVEELYDKLKKVIG